MVPSGFFFFDRCGSGAALFFFGLFSSSLDPKIGEMTGENSNSFFSSRFTGFLTRSGSSLRTIASFSYSFGFSSRSMVTNFFSSFFASLSMEAACGLK